MNKKKGFLKYLGFAAIFLTILSVTLISIYFNNFSHPDVQYIAEKGLIDLSDWEKDEGKNVRLSGEWAFYPNQFINQDEIDTSISNSGSHIFSYVEVPGSWESYLNEEGTAEGAGTFYLIIKVPEDRTYGIKTKTIRTASRTYINGIEVAHTGSPGLTRESFVPESKYKTAFFKSENKEIHLLMHVSSFGYRSGGIISPIEFGTFESISKKNTREIFVDTLLISICLTLGLYFLFTFFIRRKEIYLLYFSFIGFLMSAYLATMNEQMLSLLIDYNAIVRIRIQIFLMITITFCFFRFTHYYFKDYCNHRIGNVLSKFNMLLFLFIFNNPTKPFSLPVGTVQIIIMFSFVVNYSYIFCVLAKAIFKKAESISFVIVIAASMFSYWLSIFLKTLFELNLGYIPVILIINIMVGITMHMGRRLYLDYLRANELSEKLIINDKIMGDFLATAPHEIEKPLNKIVFLTKSLIEGRRGVLNPEQLEDLYFINEEIRKLDRLTTDLSEASILERGNIELKLRPVNINQMVNKIFNQIKVLTPVNKAITFKNEIVDDFPLIMADTERTKQILYNLLENAVNNTDKGEITISASQNGGWALIKVKDTGIGIEKKAMVDIFKIFYKKDRDDSQQGLGLGLSIVKYLVEIHGGKIEVDSKLNRGTVFMITLPLWDEDDSIATEINKPFEASINYEETSGLYKGKPTILIVDGDQLSQKNLSQIINQLEINTIASYSGDEALKVLKERKIDLVIINYELPDISGAELCRMIRKGYSMTELPILYLTEVGRAMGFDNTTVYGINDFQKKHVDADVFLSRIQSLLLMKASVEESLNREYQYFYSQISPHFLYNTLNTIIGLSYTDMEKSREALYNLSVYFRGKLEIHRQKSLISLETELELTMAYLEIEKIRFNDRLKVTIDIDDNLAAMIPPLSLQPLLENSIKHGIAPKKEGGEVKILIKSLPYGFVGITIEDNGVGMPYEMQEKLMNGDIRTFGFSGVLKG